MGVIGVHDNVCRAISTSGVGECFLFIIFLHGATVNRGDIWLGALPVFCVVVEEKHTVIMTAVILAD